MNQDRQDHRLSVLLKLRRQCEDSARLAFESARTRADAAEVQVRRLWNLLDLHNAEARSAMIQDRAAMARYRQSVGDIRAALADANRFLAEARVELEHRRTELTEAMQQRKAAEALRRRSAAAAAAGQYRLETRTADDLHADRQAAKTAARH